MECRYYGVRRSRGALDGGVEATWLMEEGSWFGPLCFFAGLAVAGGAILLGKDWIERRARRGEPPLASSIVNLLLALAVLMVFLWFCLAVGIVVTTKGWH